MSLQIRRADITKVHADAIVNSARGTPMIGTGIDAWIHKAAGPELLAELKKVGRIEDGEVRATGAGNLSETCSVKYVFHAKCPPYNAGSSVAEDLLRKCYRDALELADKKHCKSIAFPLLGSGVYQFKKKEALRIAITEILDFLFKQEMEVILVLFDTEAVELARKILPLSSTELEESESERIRQEEYDARSHEELQREIRALMNMLEASAKANLQAQVKEYLRRSATADNFSCAILNIERILKVTAPDVYKKAGVSKQIDSRMQNTNAAVQKDTAVKYAIALELDEESADNLLRRAGYALGNSVRDKILRDFIKEKNYNMTAIDERLCAEEQKTLFT